MPRIFAQIPTMSEADLFKLFKNACRELANGPNDLAQSILTAIGTEWKRRRDLLLGLEICLTRPNEGMLSALGYHVGEKGERATIRRKILARAIEGELPMIGSPAYTAEWGAPNSRQRYRKLTNFLQAQITNPAYVNMAKAIIEWSEDLDWVEQNYRHL
jgi:hypothetical protein